MDISDLALLVLRVWVGAVMFVHGAQHLRTREGTGRWLGRIGWLAPGFQAWLLSAGEIAIGAGMILGFMNAAAASGTLAIMVVAFVTQHLRNGFFIYNKGQGYEYVVTLALAAAALALLGAGEWSLDTVLGTGLGPAERGWILLAGLGLAAIHMASSWRPGLTATRDG